MSPPALARFFALLAPRTGRHVFNPWTQRDPSTDAADNGPEVRRERLAAHLRVRPARILIGEAAGYQGCHVSGVPFTSERLVMAGVIPRLSSNGRRLSVRTRPWSEPSATTVWNTLRALGIAADTVLWNAFPWHPHQPDRLHSNRTPTRAERAQGLLVLEALLKAFPGVPVFAVGRHAEAALLETGRAVVALRHPSMGGATAFRSGLEAALIRNSRSKCG